MYWNITYSIFLSVQVVKGRINPITTSASLPMHDCNSQFFTLLANQPIIFWINQINHLCQIFKKKAKKCPSHFPRVKCHHIQFGGFVLTTAQDTKWSNFQWQKMLKSSKCTDLRSWNQQNVCLLYQWLKWLINYQKKKLINLISRLSLGMRTTKTKHKLNFLKFEWCNRVMRRK